MDNLTGKTKSRKTTVFLSVILVLLVLFSLSFFLIIPAARHYYIMHIDYPVYGGMNGELTDNELFEDMQSGRSFCFLGDSITCGNEIEGITWYRPLIPYIKGGISNLSHAGWMVGNLLQEKDNIPVADVYVVAVGVNDVMFPKSRFSGGTPIGYTSCLRELARAIKVRSRDAKIYFIAPWTFHNQDEVSTLRAENFRHALYVWCKENGYICIDPDPVLVSVFKENGTEAFMKDDFHPNAPAGVGLYSYAVLKADHDRKTSSN